MRTVSSDRLEHADAEVVAVFAFLVALQFVVDVATAVVSLVAEPVAPSTAVAAQQVAEHGSWQYGHGAASWRLARD